jgi:hypothetical protein
MCAQYVVMLRQLCCSALQLQARAKNRKGEAKDRHMLNEPVWKYRSGGLKYIELPPPMHLPPLTLLLLLLLLLQVTGASWT